MSTFDIMRTADEKGAVIYVRYYIDPESKAPTYRAQIERKYPSGYVVKAAVSTSSPDEAIEEAAQKVWGEQASKPEPKKQAKRVLKRKPS